MRARAFVGDLTAQSHIDAAREGLAFIGAERLIGPQTRVFLKPNLTFPTYVPGVMTSPQAVEAAIVALKDYTPHITVGDSDSGGYNRFSMDEVYREIGMIELGRRYGVEIVNLSHTPRRSVPLAGGRREISVDLPVLLTEETDQLVTLPVPKVHMNSGVSLSFKNQWGCIPENTDRLRLHPDMARVLLEVNKAIHANIAIIDGTFGLNRSGPLRGDAVPLNWMLVADDLGAGARLGCELMQIPLSRIAHLRYLERRGVVPARSEIVVNRELAPFLREPFYLERHWTDYPGVVAFNSRTVAYLGYFSPMAAVLHKLLYLFREPFYDHERHKVPSP